MDVIDLSSSGTCSVCDMTGGSFSLKGAPDDISPYPSFFLGELLLRAIRSLLGRPFWVTFIRDLTSVGPSGSYFGFFNSSDDENEHTLKSRGTRERITFRGVSFCLGGFNRVTALRCSKTVFS